ncbi:carboxymethylenebutenolidase [Dongia mobilis]|uniref:Carboxymethylenebutenolidase n=1 Tax=Dongia mobilis TaxID=578943 RepID=A0A4R6WJE4_9PROT|nr:dienelactone hydrolase family protein [Dongia mobilis]TDQ78794.1 carboxymethylenebutenolidase [Dongia mobilis]
MTQKPDQTAIDLYDRFTHGEMDRRNFLEKLTILAGSSAAAYAMLPLLQNNYARAEIVLENDPRIVTETVVIGGFNVYLARPAEGDKFPAVEVIHENRGLNPHIKDVTRRMATEGFLAGGVDFLSPLGGTPADEDKAREMIGTLDRAATIKGGVEVIAGLRGHASSSGKVGAVGFCWGGALVNSLAVADPTLNAGVAYYGMQPDVADVPKIEAPLLLHYAGIDERVNAGIDAYKAALETSGKRFQLYMYEGANHAFNNDTNAARYDASAAALAWGRTIEFLKTELA